MHNDPLNDLWQYGTLKEKPITFVDASADAAPEPSICPTCGTCPMCGARPRNGATW